jgi:hypothetical protein
MTRNNQMYYNILEEYTTPLGAQFDWRIGNDTLTDAGFSNAQAQAAFQYFWARWQAIGGNITTFMQLTCMTAAISDAIWSGHAAAYTATCQSRVNINIPAGRYEINFPLPLAFGIYSGQGSSEFFTNGPDFGGTFGQGSTSLHLDQARWLGDDEDAIWQSGTWGDENLFGYNEAFQLLNMRLVGNKASNVYNPLLLKCGVQVWDMGSNAFIHNVFADDFEGAGFHHVRGTYVNYGQAASFNNNLAAFWLEGGGQHNFNSVESDECPAVFRVEGGYGRVGSTSFHCSWYKSETGPAPNRPVGKGTMVMDAQGWVQASFGHIQYAAVNGAPHCMFRINADFNNTGTLSNSCQVSVDMFALFGPCYGLLHDVFNRKMWINDALSGQFNKNGYFRTRVKNFRWTSELGGALISDFFQPVLVTNMATGRLGTLAVDNNTGAFIGAWDNQAGTPPYTIAPPAGEGSVPPPPPPPPPIGIPTNIVVSLNPTTVVLGQTSQASVVVTDQFGNTITPAGTWSIVSGSATITGAGVVTALSAGGILVQYSQGAVSGSNTLTANNPAPQPPVPTTINVTLSSSTIPFGGTVQATAVVFDQNGVPMSASGTWSIASGPATISGTGLVTTTAPGSVVVRYTVNAIVGTANLLVQNVEPPPPPPGPTPLYSVTFNGLNPVALPGCVNLASAPWKAGSITGPNYSTQFDSRPASAINANQVLSPVINGVRRIVLKGAIIRENANSRWLNNAVRTNGNRQFVLASNLNTVVGSFTTNAAAVDITILLPTPTTISQLFGGSPTIFNTLNLSCTGVELWAA